MGNPVVHFEIVNKDHKALVDFYSGVFDWSTNPIEGMPYTGIDTDPGARPTGGIGAPPEGYPGHVTFYVLVDEIDAKLKEIESKGGKTVQPKMDVPNGPTIALFADPAGNTIGLLQG
jgi:predicted enzyme related to lactoylglutathione lyase